LPQLEYSNWDIGIMEYWNDGVMRGNTKNPLFPLLIATIPRLQHSIFPRGWHKRIVLRDNGIPQKLRELQVANV
jgi:hypothetical protein